MTPSPTARRDTTTIGALTAAKTANGTWADTCDSAHRALTYAKRYQFTLAAPALVDVSLTSGAGDSELYLIQGTSAFGTRVTSDVYDRELPTSETRLAWMLGAGTYTIEATTAKPGVTGAFTLTATPTAIASLSTFAGNSCRKDLGALSSTAIRDAWAWSTGADCKTTGGEQNLIYTFSLTARSVLTFNLFSHSLDRVAAALLTLDGSDYEHTQDYQPRYGESGVSFSRTLEAGSYAIKPYPDPRSGSGGFGMRISAAAPLPICAAADLGIMPGASPKTESGSWSAACGSLHRADVYAKQYRFTLSEASRIDASLTSGAVDTNLYLFVEVYETAAASDGTTTATLLGRYLVEEDDDGGAGSNSRIKTSLSDNSAANRHNVFILEAATDEPGAGAGSAFSLSLTATPRTTATVETVSRCATEDMGEIHLRATRSNTWSDDCDSGFYVNRATGKHFHGRGYAFTLASRSLVTIDLKAETDTRNSYMTLVSNDGTSTLIESIAPGPGDLFPQREARHGRGELQGGGGVDARGRVHAVGGGVANLGVSAGRVRGGFGDAQPRNGRGGALRQLGNRLPFQEQPRGATRGRTRSGLDEPARANVSILSSLDAVFYLRKDGDRNPTTTASARASRPDWLDVHQLAPGAYRVEATSEDRAAAGEFEIAVSVDPPITSEGAKTHNSGVWNERGVTGEGITVGVVDSGFWGYADRVGVELPQPSGQLCYDYSGEVDCLTRTYGVHGTAVSEAIADIAPGADLFIVDPHTTGDLREAVDAMVGAGVSVINMSLIWPWEGPPGGVSPKENGVSRAVDAATRGGALWVNSAGNSNGGGWRGAYADADSDGLIEFETGDETNQFQFDGFGCPMFEMRWDDVWGGASRDMDLYAIDSTGRVIASSVDYQNGQEGHYPYEAMIFCVFSAFPEQYRIVARRESGDAPAWVEIRNFGGSLKLEHAEGSMDYPADMANPAVLAVGAAAWFDTSDVESYSSLGPTADGRIKPDVVGADKGASSVYGEQFGGTSQASPHVAGMAALVRQLNPHMSAQEAARYLKDQAIPRPAVSGGALEVPNNVWGYGLARLPGSREMRTETPRELKYPSAGVDDRFGWAAAISADGNTAAVGAKDADLAAVGGARSGAVYVFAKSAGAWSSGVKLVPSDGADGDAFGWSVAISSDGNTLVVGAQGEDVAGADGESAGAAYVFVKSAGAWSTGAKLTADDRAGYQGFGYSVSISGDGNTVVAGALGHATNTGAAYVFTKPAGGWGTSPISASKKLTAADSASRDFFGVSVSTNSDGSAVAVGASGDEGYTGSAYVFTRPTGGWTVSSAAAKLAAADGSLADRFGASLSMSADGSTVVVGAYADHYRRGSAYVFAKPAGGWGTSPMSSSVKLAAADGDLGRVVRALDRRQLGRRHDSGWREPRRRSRGRGLRIRQAGDGLGDDVRRRRQAPGSGGGARGIRIRLRAGDESGRRRDPGGRALRRYGTRRRLRLRQAVDGLGGLFDVRQTVAAVPGHGRSGWRVRGDKRGRERHTDGRAGRRPRRQRKRGRGVHVRQAGGRVGKHDRHFHAGHPRRERRRGGRQSRSVRGDKRGRRRGYGGRARTRERNGRRLRIRQAVRRMGAGRDDSRDAQARRERRRGGRQVRQLAVA